MRLTGACLLALLVLFSGIPAPAEEDAPAHPGSPYRDLAELETGQIVHLHTGVPVSLSQMLDTLSGARVIYIGETHDNLEAHRVQLEVIRGLSERFPGQVAIGLEMFRRSAQPELDAWHRGHLEDRAFRSLFHRHWGMDYGLYAPIFDYARERRIPLIGLKSSQEMEQALRAGGPGQPGLPEIDVSDPYHRAYSLSLFGGSRSHADKVSKPYQMLLLWEEAMAEAVSGFLTDRRYPDWKLVVLAGGFHVQYGFGIPKRAFRRVPHPYAIVLPVVTHIPAELKDREMEFPAVDVPLVSADFGWKVDYRVPPPKKIRLGVFLEEIETGLKVREAQPGSNAEAMGLQAGDVILSLEGRPVADTRELSGRLQQHDFGDTVHLKVLRDGREIELSGMLKKPEEGAETKR